MKTVTIYTDGACSGNPGPGGWASILRYGDAVKELSGGESMQANIKLVQSNVRLASELAIALKA